MKRFMNWMKNEESGQGMVEYGLIIALVAIACVTALTGVGTKIIAVFNDIVAKL